MAADGASGAAGAAIGWKLIGGLAGLGAIGAGLATLIVMCMTRPQNDREWVVALTSTVCSSLFGGAALVRWLELQHWLQDPIGAVGLIGFVFACGLPGWALVRWCFNFMQRRQDKDIAEIAQEVRRQINGG
jgi:hypothetical protein